MLALGEFPKEVCVGGGGGGGHILLLLLFIYIYIGYSKITSIGAFSNENMTILKRQNCV